MVRIEGGLLKTIPLPLTAPAPPAAFIAVDGNDEVDDDDDGNGDDV